MSSRLRSIRWLLAAIPATVVVGSFASEWGGADGSPRRVTSHIAYASTFAPAQSARADSAFAKLVQRLSEPGGYFDSDNLISNETSYLHVLDGMRRLKVQGGAYIGVGPDQNFSYIAAVRPDIAFMIDIRRDNLLEHLLFKSLFAMSRNRIEYLCLLFGKPLPRDFDRWASKSIQELVDYIDATHGDADVVDSVQSAISQRVRRFGIPLSTLDLETIARIRDAFVRDSLDLRYSSIGRAPRPYHPTYRQLLLEKDRSGRQANYLASEDAFQFVKNLEARDLIVPVVGNAAGEHALSAIGQYIAERGDKVSALYISNVEQYLIRDGGFPQFAENVKLLPRDRRSVMIRSFFGYGYGFGTAGAHPLNVAGHYSTQILQTIDAFVATYDSGAVRSYYDLISKNYVAP
ncbi:MAG TPA: hypothetical protein VFD67_13915 [Gemmatimonadaceae bacterium]|nr:hypothetical protein [Gemmatimonadaceae bacterium]